ncbi:hypothetical protein M378DRAFT_68631 [Amanita muscaria Koide BX008]|uniref:Uncharacterized protein n=1 Tax=Amanita muscaria (strain Koide BX008) TaxID=946122 RepID=A0A0C2XJZ9_AMAMK|nr:hypothetical protein M378DRAFT_68631 [Amanita muscaria Koide BX008]
MSKANASLKLLTLDILQDVFTSVEDECSDGIMRFCTTDQVLWIDKRYATKPLLGFKHDRDHDYTLQTHTFLCERELTILTSRKSSVMTLYDVSRPPGYPLSIHDSPYCIHPPSNCGTSNLGQLLFRHPHSFYQPSFTLFQIHERGDITCFDVSVPSQGGSDMVLEWSNQIDAMKTEGDNRQEDAGPLGMRERKERQLDLFHICDEKREKPEKAEAEIIYDIIEQALMFWRKAETSEEQILTSFDILFRAGEMPQSTSNSDFLSDTIINSDSVFQALARGRISAEMLGKGSMWHHDISPVLRHHIPEATQNVQRLTDSLSQLDLNIGGNRTQGSIRREIRAREQLALDMVLASNIYSSHPFADSVQKSQDLESLTEALSLNSDAPPIQFGYLRPIRQDVGAADDKDLGDVVTCSPGIRLLLKEWTVGTDPKEYTSCETEGPEKTKTSVEDTATQKTVQPPAIVKVDLIAPPPIPRRAVTHSQPIGETTDGLADSQEIMASTQILPGPYGGRSVLSKKKPAKKRTGGF